ncbi:MAG TPA: two-component regulator propeller domain-containing protein, partial [Opitutus sp.]|nr:two-component regulator propeller domain-containing protein [Opitutus sp.]
MKSQSCHRRRLASPSFSAGGLLRTILTVMALLCAARLPLHALDPAKSIYQFNCQNWTRLAGLPADKVTSIAQTPDGYIWLASQNGLVRFDGVEFKVVPITLREAHGQEVRTLSVAPDGALWFSINTGGFGRYDGATFSPIEDPRWTTAEINGITLHAGSDGAIWTASVNGWSRWVKDRPAETVFEQLLGPMIVIWEDDEARVWFGTAERGLHFWEKGEFKAFPADELKQENVRAVTRDRAGDLWVGTGRGLFHYDAQNRLKEVFWPEAQTNALLVDHEGELWVGTDRHGVGRYRNGRFTFLNKSHGLSNDNVTALFEDAEGSLWIGTVDGLSQLTDLKFPIFSGPEGLVPGEALDVYASPRGGLWIGMGKGASHFDGATARNFTDNSVTPNLWVRRVFEARDGRVMLADGDKNITVLSGDRVLQRFKPDSWPEAFVEDADGVVVGIGPSLHRLTGDRLEPYAFDGPAPEFNWINTLCVARDGALWVASNNGLYRVQHGRHRSWFAADGLPSNRVHYVMEDEDRNIWVGTSTGMARLKDGRCTVITAANGLSDDRIYAIIPDDHGQFWLSSGHGILRVSRENLNQFADGRIQRVESHAFDGLESVKFTDRTDQGFSGCKTVDGRIWFPNPLGVVMIDPASYFVNRVPPRVRLESIAVNGRSQRADEPLVLRAGDRRIEFSFAALSYIAPKKVQVQYRLDGYDDDWVDAGAQRSVVYNGLPAGRYTFQVRAANADGVWSTVPVPFAFELPPPFYQRWWFYAICALGLAGSSAAGYRWKVRHLRRLQKKLQQENDALEAKVGLRTDELAHSLSLLKATLDSTADGILALEFSGKIVTFNSHFVAMWSIPLDRMLQGGTVVMRDFVAQQVKDPAAFLERIEQLRLQGETEAFDVIELKDGRLFERYIKPQRLNGSVVGIVINFRDITERRRAEAIIAESSALLESLLSHTLDIVYFKDRESRFVRYSDTLLRRYGLTERHALRGKSDFDLYPKEQAQAFFDEEQ